MHGNADEKRIIICINCMHHAHVHAYNQGSNWRGLGGFTPPPQFPLLAFSFHCDPQPPNALVPAVLLTLPVHFSQFEPCMKQACMQACDACILLTCVSNAFMHASFGSRLRFQATTICTTWRQQATLYTHCEWTCKIFRTRVDTQRTMGFSVDSASNFYHFMWLSSTVTWVSWGLILGFSCHSAHIKIYSISS